MVLNKNLELMVKGCVYGWDSETIVSIASELLAARKLIAAMRKRKDTECEFGTGCKLPEDEDSECDWCEIRRLLAAYDAATKGE